MRLGRWRESRASAWILCFGGLVWFGLGFGLAAVPEVRVETRQAAQWVLTSHLLERSGEATECGAGGKPSSQLPPAINIDGFSFFLFLTFFQVL